MAIDRQGLIKAGEKGVADPAQALATRSTWTGVPTSDVDAYYAELPQYPYDVAKAKASCPAVIPTSPTSRIRRGPYLSSSTPTGICIAA